MCGLSWCAGYHDCNEESLEGRDTREARWHLTGQLPGDVWTAQRIFVVVFVLLVFCFSDRAEKQPCVAWNSQKSSASASLVLDLKMYSTLNNCMQHRTYLAQQPWVSFPIVCSCEALSLCWPDRNPSELPSFLLLPSLCSFDVSGSGAVLDSTSLNVWPERQIAKRLLKSFSLQRRPYGPWRRHCGNFCLWNVSTAAGFPFLPQLCRVPQRTETHGVSTL